MTAGGKPLEIKRVVFSKESPPPASPSSVVDERPLGGGPTQTPNSRSRVALLTRIVSLEETDEGGGTTTTENVESNTDEEDGSTTEKIKEGSIVASMEADASSSTEEEHQTCRRRLSLPVVVVEQESTAAGDAASTMNSGEQRPFSASHNVSTEVRRSVSEAAKQDGALKNDKMEESAKKEETAAASPQEDCKKAMSSSSSSSSSIPLLPNPLHDAELLKIHIYALRLEAELHPLRLILSRIMSHVSLNRKGLFNSAVDPVALKLPDYFDIIQHPMDLGKVKARLHAVAYKSRAQVAEDVRLVFANAMRYNPPHNSVHQAAKALLQIFEEAYQGLNESDDATVSSSSSTAVVGAADGSPTASFSQATAAKPQANAVPTAVSSSNTVSSNAVPKTASTQAIKSQTVLVASSAAVPAKLQASQDCQPQVRPNDAAAAHVAFSPQEALPETNASLPVVPPIQPPATEAPVAASCAPPPPPGQPVPFACAPKPAAAPPPAARTRASETLVHGPLKGRTRRKRRPTSSLPSSHFCDSCQGRTCRMCHQGCLGLEPSLLICDGVHCAGSKIRKGALYYISQDGARHYCLRCHASLAAVLTLQPPLRYKRDLIKRRNDEEIAEKWLTCVECHNGVHETCAMHNGHVHSSDNYHCPECVVASRKPVTRAPQVKSGDSNVEELYTYLSGSDGPVPMSNVVDTNRDTALHAESLKETDISSFLQQKVRERLVASGCPKDAEKTIVVRPISDCTKYFKVPDVVRKHFCMASDSGNMVPPPLRVKYQSKALALFQKIDGLDVCIFCMYVQEYSGDDEYEQEHMSEGVPKKKRVYIAYLDSVEHFRPRACRTNVYQEMLVSYLATARARGFETAHIWACPPSRGNSFVFWNHPASQRTPTKERLVSWYHGALSRAVDCGVVTDVKSLYESDFQKYLSVIEESSTETGGSSVGKMVCPPLLEDDFWIEEAVRIHGANIARRLKAPLTAVVEDFVDNCPARQVASLIRDRIMRHPSSHAFRRPLNAAALKLDDYHKIIAKPMDFGTVYSQCVLGEYAHLEDVVNDVLLIVSNAKRYNPQGHFVHTKAVEVESLFFRELNLLTSIWGDGSNTELPQSWTAFKDMSMGLDTFMDSPSATGNFTDGSSMGDSVPCPMNVEEDSPSPKAGGDSSLFETSASDCLNSKSPPVTTSSGPLETPAQDEPCKQPEPLVVAVSASGEPPAPSDQESTASSKTSRKAGKKPSVDKKLELLSDGPEAVLQKMVGDDVWLLEKRNPAFKGKGKRRRSSAETIGDEQRPKQRRRQSWLGEEVGASVRKNRTSFFTCSLISKASCSETKKDGDSYDDYVRDLRVTQEPSSSTPASRMADSRYAFLEFSQFRSFQFDTLRRAKYSTAMLLYHLHHDDAPGTVPCCTSCHRNIQVVRWHKVKKVGERRMVGKGPLIRGAARPAVETKWEPEELCSACHSNHARQDDFIPIQVSLRRS